MLIPKVNIHNVHLLENPMKSTAYPLLPPPGTLKATEYFTIILLFVRRRANKQQRGTNITWPINILGMSAAFLGPFVEKDIKKSALISTVCFACRFAGTGASIAAGCPRRAHLLWRNHGHWIGRRLSDAGEEPNAVVRQRSRHRHRRRGIRSGQGHRGKHQRHPDRRCRVQRCRRCLSSTLSAWAFAGLSGNQLASFVVSHTTDAAHRYSALIPIITILYAVALASIIAMTLATKGKSANTLSSR